MKPARVLQFAYLTMLPGLVSIAREHGYALGVHGSLARDFDLIACPWSRGATSAESLIRSICDHVRAVLGTTVDGRQSVRGPHGRRSFSLHLGRSGREDVDMFLDVSVMPRSPALLSKFSVRPRRLSPGTVGRRITCRPSNTSARTAASSSRSCSSPATR